MAAEAPGTIGRYQVSEPLGRSSAASCFRAVDPKTNRTVEVRLLSARFAASPAAAEVFARDAEELSRLEHPNLVRVLDFGREGERPFVVTEPFDGKRLAEVLRARRLAIKEAISVWKEMLKGLAHAHQHRVVHRDLHPGAVLVSPDLARVKLTDFGVGRLEVLTGTTGTIATSEFSLGTLQYLAPEQAEGKPPDPRSDIYAAGAIFHEMLTGRAPGGKFALPSQLNTDLPSDVDVLVLKCLARNPAERYGTVVHLLGDLERLEETLKLRLLGEIEGITRSTSRLLGKEGGGGAGAKAGAGAAAGAAGESEAKKGLPVMWVAVAVLVIALLIVAVVVLR